MASLTGYGPLKSLRFSGDEEDFELWSVKFKAYLRLNKLHKILEGETAGDEDKNAEVYATLVQALDDKSLNLIIRDAADDGRKSFAILEEHYLGKSKPKIISLYCELTSLRKNEDESVTDYIIRAERASTRLKQADEVVSDGLLTAMVLKGLPDSYKAFCTIITQTDSDKMNFSKFKTALRSYEETENSRKDSTMASNNRDDVYKLSCYKCGKPGHVKSQCNSKFIRKSSSRWCTFCEEDNHDTRFCRFKNKKTNVKSMQEDDDREDTEEEDYFVFKVAVKERDDIFKLNDKNALLVDCGASASIVCDPSKFINLDKTFNSNMHIVELADNSQKTGLATHRGDALLSIRDSNGNPRRVMLKNALCVPSFKQNIVSVHAMTENGMEILFSPKSNHIVAPNGVTFDMNKKGKLYYLEEVTHTEDKASKVKIRKSLNDWHNILGHCNKDDLLSLEKGHPDMEITDKKDINCGTCIQAKMTQQINHTPDPKATEILQLVHTDLSGPMHPPSIQGCRYTICFIDDFSGLITVYFLKNKSDATQATKKFIADMAPYGKIKRIRSDNGGEYTGKAYEDLLIENKIRHEFSAPFSPHQNGTAERSWRTLFNVARSMLLESNLPKSLWTYAVRHASFTRNRCYSKQIGTTPYEKFLSKKPDLKKIHKFGENCYSHVIKPASKLCKRGEPAQYIGQDTHSPASLVYRHDQDKVVKARSIVYITEKPVNTSERSSTPRNQEEEDETWTFPISTEASPVSSGDDDEEEFHESSAEQVEVPECAEIPSTENNRTSERYPSRDRQKPSYLRDYELGDQTAYVTDYEIDYFCRVSSIPETYKQAISSNDSVGWVNAMKTEFEALCENETFDLVSKPNKKVIGGRWVFARKKDENGVEIFKARYVAKGFSQVPYVDYGETFSPTAKLTSVRLVLQAAVNNNMSLYQLDVKTAYLNATIDYDIFVTQPPGFVEVDREGNELVWKLKKSLYGLKQSGRMWHNCLHDFLISNGFKQMIPDNCVYVWDRGVEILILIVWVDDIVIATKCVKTADHIKEQLSSRFKMKDFGTLSNFLGIQFEVSVGSIKMHQSEYAQKILERFNMLECHPKSLPCNLDSTNIDFDNQSPYLEDNTLYREIVGSLIYLMTCTRPDLCYVVTVLSQNLSKPKMVHLNLAKHVLRYLKGTQNHGLVYKGTNKLQIIGYTDASWASTGDRRSISGYCYSMSENSSLVSWKSKKQSVVALSSCESEYIGITLAMQEGVFLKQMFDGIGLGQSSGVLLNVDNMGAIDLSKNPVHHQRSKHIDVRFHYLRSKVLDGSFVLKYVPSKENVADIFTKACTKASLTKFYITKPI